MGNSVLFEWFFGIIEPMKETRLKKIFDLLSENQSYLTSEKIALELNVSPKTVRNEIKVLDALLEKHGGHVDAKARYGYRFEVVDMDLFRDFLANHWAQYAYEEDNLSYKPSRVQFLLKTLLFEKNYLRANDLCEQLAISKSQLSADLQILRQKIEPYQLYLDVRPHHGMKINGSELNLRLCIANLLYNDGVALEEDEFETQWILDEMRRNILHVFNHHHYETSEVVFHNLVIHLFVALERVKIGESIVMDTSHLESLKDSVEYLIAHEIISELERQFGYKFPEDEKGYVSMHLSGKRVYGQSELEPHVVSAEVDDLVVAMIDRVRLVMDVDLTKDLELRVALGLHSEPMVKRIRYKLMMKNPLLADIKAHKQAFETATVASEVINVRYHTKLTEDEIAYLALHFYLALERHKVAVNRKRVLLVCSTGHGTARLLEYRFKQEFNAFLEEVVTKDALSIRNLDLRDYDLIVSTVPLSVKTITPIIYVSTLLSDQDLQALRHRFNQDERSIAEYFDRKLFYKDVLANSKEEIIFFMAQKISELRNFEEGFYESILRREDVASTEFGNLIAIPHPDKPYSSNTIVSVAILKKPIQWKERMVQLVFMLAYGNHEHDNLDVFFAKSAQFLTSASDINATIQANDYDDFMKIIDRK